MGRKKGFLGPAMVILFLVTVEVCGLAEVNNPKASKKGAKAEEPEVSTQKAETKPKIVYKFKNSQEMAEFQKMYQQVQFIETRIAVLQDYLVQERANLEQLNAQMFLKFKFVLEPNRQYRLDTVDMTITEITPAQEVQTQSPSINPANPCPGDTCPGE